jgi:hypothetical protein
MSMTTHIAIVTFRAGNCCQAVCSRIPILNFHIISNLEFKIIINNQDCFHILCLGEKIKKRVILLNSVFSTIFHSCIRGEIVVGL